MNWFSAVWYATSEPFVWIWSFANSSWQASFKSALLPRGRSVMGNTMLQVLNVFLMGGYPV